MMLKLLKMENERVKGINRKIKKEKKKTKEYENT